MTAPAAPRAATPLTLIGLHAKLHVLQTVRVPFILLSVALFPAMAFAFFVLPQGFADDPRAATAGAAQLALFSITSVCLFSFGAGVAEDRALPWDATLRVLPAGPVPRLAGRVLSGLAMAVLGLAPLVVLAGATTAATLPVARWIPTLAGLLLAAAPLLTMGLTLGYALPAKAAVASAQVLLLPMSFAGGLFLPPDAFPGWLDAASRLLPTRAGREVVVALATGAAPPASSIVVLLVWFAAMSTTATWAYLRDEGARYR